MKTLKINIPEWSDFTKWFWDRFCFPRRKLVAEWLGYHRGETRSLMEKILLKYNDYDLEEDNYALLCHALKDWDKEVKEIYDKTEKLIMMK